MKRSSLTSKKPALAVFILVILSLFLSACVRMAYQPRQQFLLNPANSILPKRTPRFDGTLFIDRVTILSPYSNNNFVYRTHDVNYTIDYYNLFLAPPAEQIYQIENQYFARANLFTQILESASIIKPNYWLSAKIMELYADYRDNTSPKGVISIQFTLYQLDSGASKTNKVFERTYQKAVRLSQKNSVSLVHAWDLSLQEIFKNLIDDLYAIKAPTNGSTIKPKITTALTSSTKGFL